MYAGKIPMFFIMQLLEECKFEIVLGAQGQMKMNFYTGIPEPSADKYYELFLGNNIYFFGTQDKENPLVYVVTQI